MSQAGTIHANGKDGIIHSNGTGLYNLFYDGSGLYNSLYNGTAL